MTLNLTVLFFLNILPLFKIPVPSSVSGVTVNNSGRSDYLSISWLPAPGDVDNYVVTLSHDGRVLQALVIAKSVGECSFSSLTPGRLYNVTITTRSGKYESHSFSQERTGEAFMRYRLSENQPPTWLRASGTHVCVLSCFSPAHLFVSPWTVAHQAPLSMGFSRQEYWSGLPCRLPGHLPDPGIEPTSLMSPALAGGFFITSTTWEAPQDIIDLHNSVRKGLKTAEITTLF